MLSNYIVGQYKFVLFVDQIGIENDSEIIIKSVLDNNRQSYEKFYSSNLIADYEFPTAVVLKPFSKLELEEDESSIATIIHVLKRNRNVTQIFGWLTTKNIKSRLLIPFLSQMSDSVVNILSENLLSIMTKRKYGNVKFRHYQHDLIQGNMSIKEQKALRPALTIETWESTGTFKIGEFNSSELEAKKNMKLPFEL